MRNAAVSLRRFGVRALASLVAIGGLALAPTPGFAAGCCRAGVGTDDFNGDGNADIVVAQIGPTLTPTTSVRVYLGNGDGTLGAPVNFPAGVNPISVVTGDFRGIGVVDLAVANLLSGDVTMSLGNGDGTFGPAVSYPVGGRPMSITRADFNGDGVPDLAVANGQSVVLLIGNGDGTFQAPVSVLTGGSITTVVAADLRGIGVYDLVAPNYQADHISVLLGNGDGTFGPPVSYQVGREPDALTVGRFRSGAGPGLDIAVANSEDGSVSILLNKGDGTFASSGEYTLGGAPVGIVAGSFHANSVQDLAVVGFTSRSVTILLANGDGTFTVGSSYLVGEGPSGIVAVDLANDHRLDLVVANTGGTLTILLGNGDGTFHS